MKLFLCWLVVAFAVLGASAHAGFASPSELRGPSSALSVDLYWTGLPRSSAPSALFAEADGRSSVSARGRRGLGYLREIRERLRHLFAVAFASFAIWTAGRSQGGGISATSPLQFRPPAAVASSDSGGNGHSLCYVGFSGLIHKDHLISLPGGEVAPLRAVKPYPTAERGAREGQPDVTWFDTFHESEQVRSLSCFA